VIGGRSLRAASAGLRGGLMGCERNGRIAAGGSSARRAPDIRLAVKALAAAAIGLTVANCSAPQTVASAHRRGAGAIDPHYGVAASPRIVGENDPVPKGGGREMVGKPYVVAGRTYVPRENPRGYRREGLASWYGPSFHGRLTANGEIFDRYAIAAAHPTLPLPSYARVTNLQNKRSMIVRVNDRGPYHDDRLMDVSQQVADVLGFKRVGTTRVRVEYVGRASINGSDDQKLLASLRTDGRPAALPGLGSVMVADAGEAASPPAAHARPVKRSSGELEAEPDVVRAPEPAPSLAAARPRPVDRRAPAALAEDKGSGSDEDDAPSAPRPPERPSVRGGTAAPAALAPSLEGVLPPRRPAAAPASDERPMRVARAAR
jgi:rare lipoprotein A